MCGIAGYYGSFEPDLLNIFQNILQHRGPDDRGIWHAHNIGLVHTRLSIIDLSPAGHQPMQDDNLIITYNGEIYNYQELRQQLIKKGEHFASTTDTEVVLKMYKHYGISCLSKLNGIFAFAIWDINNKTLFVARDHIGVKPFYYTFIPQGFLFASELKAILNADLIKNKIDQEAIVNYVTYLWSPGATTMLTNVKKLEPGNAMLIQEGKLEKKWQFYDLPYRKKNKINAESDAIRETRCLVQQAVSKQMIADVPVGAFLSGGLDSSAVVACAKKVNTDNNLQCFTIDLQLKEQAHDGIVDDLPYARQVADFLQVDLNIVTVGPNIIDSLEKMIYHLDEPQGDPAPLNVLLISQLAKEQGIKVLLSGAGGDDLFSGYRRHYALQQEKYWAWLPKVVRLGLQDISNLLPQQYTITRRLSKAFKYAGFDKNERLANYFSWMEPKWLKKVLSTEILDKLSEFNPATPLLLTLENLDNEIGTLDRMLYLEGKHFLVDHNLNYTDKMGMATGIEIRVPLLDLVLIEFVTNLPENYKQRGRIGKWIFKKAMEGILPNEVIYRPKTGFGAPLRYWLRHELKEMVDDILSVSSLKKRGLFNPEGVQELITMDRQGTIDAAYPIFAILCIEMWCRIFIDKVNFNDATTLYPDSKIVVNQ